MNHLKLDFKDRLILANQYRILEKVDPENAESYKRVISILERGYEREYKFIDTRIDHSTVSIEQCNEVCDILDMYRSLRGSYHELSDNSGIDARDIVFPGFDGNNESEYLSYARFLNSTDGYTESPAINSHMPTLDTYRRMLQAFKPYRSKYPLTKDAIQEVLAARTHPSKRS